MSQLPANTQVSIKRFDKPKVKPFKRNAAKKLARGEAQKWRKESQSTNIPHLTPASAPPHPALTWPGERG
jgi:hypothetical protein